MIIKEPTSQQLAKMAKRALCAELGVANTIRFLQEYSHGDGNYTVEREALYKDKTLKDLLTEIKTNRPTQ